MIQDREASLLALGLPAEVIDFARIEIVPTGGAIMIEGLAEDALFILLRGQVSLSRLEDRTDRLLSRPAVLNRESVIEGRTATRSCIALEPVELAVLPGPIFRRLYAHGKILLPREDVGSPTGNASFPHDLPILAVHLRERKFRHALDIGAGIGNMTRLLATQLAARVTLLDPVGQERARSFLAARGCLNFHTLQAPAETLFDLPVECDLAASRLALHHFRDIHRVFDGVRLSLCDGGTLVLVDLVAPDDPEEAARLEALERKRDESHVALLDRAAILGVLEQHGFAVTFERIIVPVFDFAAFHSKIAPRLETHPRVPGCDKVASPRIVLVAQRLC